MDEFDYSQLPVVGQDERLVGVVTAESMLRALTTFQKPTGELRVHDALRPVQPIEADADLFQLLDRLASEFAVVVTDANAVVGILTAFDTSTYFRERIKDILIVEDIERTLREYVLLAFPAYDVGKEGKEILEAVQRALAPPQGFEAYKKSLGVFCKSIKTEDLKVTPAAAKEAFEAFVAKSTTVKSVSDLTFSETVNMFLDSERWEKYSSVVTLSLDAIRKMLDGVRVIRNKLAHFKGQLSGSEHQRLVQCYNWLEAHREALTKVFRPEEDRAIEQEQEDTNAAPVKIESVNIESKEGSTKTAQQSRGKYSALYAWLKGVPSNLSYTWIGFDKIEELIGDKLPPSARQGRNWWANDSTSRVQSREWLAAGFRVDDVDLDTHRVRFRRVEHQPISNVSEATTARAKELLKILYDQPEPALQKRIYNELKNMVAR